MKINGTNMELFLANLKLRETDEDITISITAVVLKRLESNSFDDATKEIIGTAVAESLNSNSVLYGRQYEYGNLLSDVESYLRDDYGVKFKNYIYHGITEDVAIESWNALIEQLANYVEEEGDANLGTWDNIEQAVNELITDCTASDDMVELWNLFQPEDEEEGE